MLARTGTSDPNSFGVGVNDISQVGTNFHKSGCCSAPGSPKQQPPATCKMEPEPHSVGLVARSRSGSFGTSALAARSGVASGGGNVSVDFKLRVATALDTLEARSALLDERTARLDERTAQLAEGTHRLESLVMGELAQLRRCV